MQIYPVGVGGVFGLQQRGGASPATANAAQPTAGRRDNVTISPQGKLAAILEGFQQQREAVMEQRGQLIAKTLDSGKSLETIEEPLALLDEKLNNLEILREQAIAGYNEQMARELREQSEKGGKTKAQAEETEEPEARNIKALSDVAAGFEQAKVVHGAGARQEGEARVAEREARQDGLYLQARHLLRWEKMGPTERAFIRGARGDAKLREMDAQAARRHAAGLQNQAAAKLADTNEKAREINGEAGEDDREEPGRDAAAAASQAISE